ncbi:hypothetical protein PFICI_10481 [Pestalotiopsis fici W106-1]|uniref:Uncharacterized protein n=1 Tax=Pestalotiopsis fici (strain W106-1 / CGMCC3.15140) TaxID=1229662 RepID=W3WX94_PESFW|nr:uncharacterized protein PFICI_10481 [Pestalotiopsis fici W106-1]ETS78419.1 hypothetical protein PFICI_10481 [Pestalotiopsis fici W106-1]
MSEGVGAVIKLLPPSGDGYLWEATQVTQISNLPPGDVYARESIDWSMGPIKVSGYLDTSTYEIGVSVTVVGVNVGNIFGNLKDGVGLEMNLTAADGEVRFYLKNGYEMWIHYDFSITFDDGNYDGDYKIHDI